MSGAHERIRAGLVEHRDLVERVLRDLVDDIDRVAALVLDTLEHGGRLFFCGNGGSAADAQHLASELVVRFKRERQPIAAQSLTTDTSVLTAGGNDLGFEHVFERQVLALTRRGDLLVLLSTSGESENLILAARAARGLGARTAALLARGGGRLRDEVDLAVVVPTESTPRAQEMHVTLGHLVCEVVDEALAGQVTAAGAGGTADSGKARGA